MSFHYSLASLEGTAEWHSLGLRRLVSRQILYPHVKTPLEMSLFCVVVFSLECALKRTPVVRAKRNCVFQQAALRSPFGAQGELALAVRRALPGWCRPEPIRNRCKMRHSRTRPQ